GVRRLVVGADRRAGVHADVERLVGGEAARDGLLHAASPDFLVIHIELHSATLSDAAFRQKHDTNGRVPLGQWLRGSHLVASLTEPVVFIDGLTTFDVKRVTADYPPPGDDDSVSPLFPQAHG